MPLVQTTTIGADPEFYKGGVLVNGNGIYCAQYNEHAKHANARGVWGHAPQENLKN